MTPDHPRQAPPPRPPAARRAWAARAPAAALALAIAPLAAAPELLPLRAPDGGPQVALCQPAANPNKPYLAQLFAPGEPPLALLDDSPPDHFHHHGLMLALGVDETDFWGEKDTPNAGRQVPAGPAAPGPGSLRQNLRWLATHGTHLLDEAREVRVRVAGEGPQAVHWLDWHSVLAPAPGRDAVKLWGRHYFGLGMRLLPPWTAEGGFVWPDAAAQKTVRGDEKLTPGPWCAASREVGGRPVTVLMVDHPANPRPARWFTMGVPFRYLAATMDLEEHPARLAAGESWTLRYGVAVLTGPADQARLARLAAEWRTSSQPPPTPDPPQS